MNYPMLKTLKEDLAKKSSRTLDEAKLLEELKSLRFLDSVDGKFSLGKAQGTCPTCGK